jgi:ubiquinone/menaquinone biosynthesis C-methylase UbiE
MDPESQAQPYVLGHDQDELLRLDRQAAAIEPATRQLLLAAGIGPGMRVLDLGTGLGHVARLAGELVGAAGEVVGIDASREALAVARERTRHAGQAHVSFVEADAATWRPSRPFDAVVGRLLLFHVADPVAVVRHQRQNLRDGGLFVAVDFDLGSARTEPGVPLAENALGWVCAAFTAAGASPRIGARLGTILERAGLQAVTTFGIQSYLQPHDPSAAMLLGSVVRSLAAVIIERGIATATEVDLATLNSRIAEALRRADAVLLPPTVVGAWGRSALPV